VSEFSLIVKKLRESGRIDPPSKEGDAGHDVYATEDAVLCTGERVCMPLGISIEFPEGFVCVVAQKSGLSKKHGLDTIGNIIDSGYRGECHAILVNNGISVVEIKRGQKIAQLLFHRCYTSKNIVYVDELEESARGDSGFGSSGD